MKYLSIHSEWEVVKSTSPPRSHRLTGDWTSLRAPSSLGHPSIRRPDHFISQETRRCLSSSLNDVRTALVHKRAPLRAGEQKSAHSHRLVSPGPTVSHATLSHSHVNCSLSCRLIPNKHEAHRALQVVTSLLTVHHWQYTSLPFNTRKSLAEKYHLVMVSDNSGAVLVLFE